MSANVYNENMKSIKLNTDRRYNDQTTRKKKLGNSFC